MLRQEKKMLTKIDIVWYRNNLSSSLNQSIFHYSVFLYIVKVFWWYNHAFYLLEKVLLINLHNKQVIDIHFRLWNGHTVQIALHFWLQFIIIRRRTPSSSPFALILYGKVIKIAVISYHLSIIICFCIVIKLIVEIIHENFFINNIHFLPYISTLRRRRENFVQTIL